MADGSPWFNRLRSSLVDDKHRAEKAHGPGAWDVADVMAIVEPAFRDCLASVEADLKDEKETVGDLYLRQRVILTYVKGKLQQCLDEGRVSDHAQDIIKELLQTDLRKY